MVSVAGASPNPNMQIQDPLQFQKSAQSGVADFTQSIMTGENIGDAAKGALENVANNIKQSAADVVKTVITQGLKRLFFGNDKADATAAKAKGVTNIAQTGAQITLTQQKVLTAGIEALKDLLMTGEVDINACAARIKDAIKVIEDKNGAAQTLQEQRDEAMKSNEEIAAKLKEYGISIGESNSEDGSKNNPETITITQKGSDGKVITKEVSLGGKKDKSKGNEGLPPEVQDLLNEYQANSVIISSIDSQISSMAAEVNSISTQVTADQQTIQTDKEQLTQNINAKSSEISTQVNGEINQVVNSGNNILTKDATDATVNATVDTTTAAAAPEIAAAETVGTLGIGSGQAATILANGVADGFAGAMRAMTGSSAVGGIVKNITSGQTLAQVAQNTLVSTANNMIAGTVNELASGLQIGELDVGALVAPELTAALKIEAPDGNQVQQA